MRTPAAHKALQDLADFDHVFEVDETGALHSVAGEYAPEVFHSETSDIEIMGGGWEALTGFTGQHGYRGAVLHSSEYVGGGLADHILATPGTYVTVVVQVLPEDADGEEGEVAGWAVLRKVQP